MIGGNNVMEDFKKKLVLEYEELDDRLKELDSFIGNSEEFEFLDNTTQILMSSQLYYMNGYRSCLIKRIDKLLNESDINEWKNKEKNNEDKED